MPSLPLPRVRLRGVLALVVTAVAVLVIVPQATELSETSHALRQARWGWLALAGGASAFTYLMAAVAVVGASGRRLPLGRTILVQLAGSVANLLAPGGLGAMGVNTRYLERSGLRWPEAIAAVALTDAAAFVVHALGLTATAAVLAKAGFEPVQLPRRWALLVGIVAAITLAGLVVRSQAGRDRLPQVRRAARSLLTVLRHPRQAALVFVGEFGVTAGYVAALWCALRAYGTHPSLLHVTAAYLLSAAIGSISPTSGGLGAIEASLVAALTGLGVPAGPAIAGVLSFRLVTYWLPAVPGFVALHTLRRRGAL